MRKIRFTRKTTRIALIVAALVAITAFAVSAASRASRPKPRAIDLINTRVRAAAVGAVLDAVPKPMLDPALDDGNTFSYFARPSFSLGVRGEPQATQVIDGHLWTGAAEWLVLLGDPPAPWNQRIWTLERDYLPAINYAVNRDGIHYSVRAFQFWQDREGASPPVNFIEVKAENRGDQPAHAAFAAGFMYGPRDHRCQQMRQVRFSRAWRYDMTDHAARRGGKVIYAWHDQPSERLARAGKPYQAAFTAAGRETPVGLARYERELPPGATLTATFAVPHYPADPDQEAALASADFNERLAAFTAYWEGWLAQGARFEVAEPKVAHASKSYLIHALMCQNVIGPDEVEQHVNRLQYNRFWLRDSSYFVSLYDKYGYPDVARALSRHFYAYQRDDGLFLSQRGQLDGIGQSLWALGMHAQSSGDAAFAREALPKIERAVAWLKGATEKDAWGVLPPTDAIDNELIAGRYTGDNFQALTGLDAVIDLCRLAGRPDLAEDYGRFRAAYAERFLARLREVAAERGDMITPGLDVPGGNDWGNLQSVYPGLIMDPADPLVTNTFEYIRRQRMQEGLVMYESTMHHYLTERVAQSMLIRGQQERALDDFYAMLLHTGSCHEGFEWNVFAWDGRDYCMNVAGYQTCNFPPHGWYAADLNLLYRNLLVREQGRVLHLASALSPAWAKPGDRVTVADAPFFVTGPAGARPGKVSYTIEFGESTLTLTVSRLDFQGPPPEDASVKFHLPYFLKLKSATHDGRPLAAADNAFDLPARPGELRLTVERLPVTIKSYEGSVDWYKKEYRRRWGEQ
jgi:hypothetical protein